MTPRPSETIFCNRSFRLAHLVVGLMTAMWVLSFWTAPAVAQKDPAVNRMKLHDAFVSAGRVFYGEGKYTEAIEQFEKALEVYPAPRLFFNLAQTYRLAGKGEKALSYYRRFLESLPTIKELTDEQKRTAEADAKKWIGQLEAEGQLAAENARKERLEKERLEKERLEKERLEKERLDKERLAAVSVPPSTPGRQGEALTAQWWFWTGVGATALLALGTAWAGTRMLDYNAEWKRTWRDSDRDKALLYQDLADVSLAGAVGAGLAVSVFTYLHLRKPSRVTGRTTHMALVPGCDGAGCMLTFTLEF